MAPGSKSGLGDIARVREYAEEREYAEVREYASEYASTRARMFDGPNFGELKSSPQAGNNSSALVGPSLKVFILPRYPMLLWYLWQLERRLNTVTSVSVIHHENIR